MESEAFARYAKAEKELCEMISPILSGAMRQVERKHGVTIREFRVTMDKNNGGGWPRANCVLVSATAAARVPKTLAARVESSPAKNLKAVDDVPALYPESACASTR
ncbi:MAG: hypothetical protein ABI981_11215 [Betaproteobacteria bacterium]